MKTAPLVIWTLLSAAPALAAPLPADQALLKLSMKLRGHGPTVDEKKAFRAAAAGGDGAFVAAFGQKADEYLDSDEFAGVIETAHQLWWRIPPGPSSKLARYIVSGNRPYDELLAKDYVYFDGEEAEFAARQGLKTYSPLPGAGAEYQAVPLAAGETRYRSVFSNRDFLNTFPDTPTNKNRKRANQIFHSFLCEVLTPAAEHERLTDDDPHGSDPACIGCHYRLDPMARFFDQWAVPLDADLGTYFDATKPAAGAVVFGSTHLDGAGESALGAILKDRPEWRQCVARRAWEFVYGAGTRLDAVTLAAVTDDFERSGRQLKAAMRSVVLHPYFWSTAEPAPTNFADVSPIIKQCGCHNRQLPHLGPDSYPWDVDPAANALVVKRMWHAVNGHAHYKRMPPDPRPALPGESVATLREWILNGAMGADLKATLTDAEIEEILND